VKKSERLQPISDFKKRQEEDAAKRLAKVSQEVSAQKQRLVDLHSYRGEYSRQFNSVGGGGMSAQKMREYQLFMHKLNTVLDQQKAAIDVLEREYEDKKRQWLAARNKLQAINKVQDRHLKKERQIEEKVSQKEQDDRNIRLVNR